MRDSCFLETFLTFKPYPDTLKAHLTASPRPRGASDGISQSERRTVWESFLSPVTAQWKRRNQVEHSLDGVNVKFTRKCCCYALGNWHWMNFNKVNQNLQIKWNLFFTNYIMLMEFGKIFIYNVPSAAQVERHSDFPLNV